MHDAIHDIIKRRYDSKEEIQRYKQRAKNGFLDWEKTIADTYFPKAGKLLNIGCGCGREAFALSKYGHKLIATDISEEVIAHARFFSNELHIAVDFRHTDGKTLSFPSGTFDYIIIWSQVLANVPGKNNRLALLKQCHNVLKQNGRISVSVHNREVCEPIARQKGLIIETDDPDLEDGDFIEKGDSESETPCYWHYFNKNEIVDLLEKSGFSVLECDLAAAFGQKNWDTILVAVAEKVDNSSNRKRNRIVSWRKKSVASAC